MFDLVSFLEGLNKTELTLITFVAPLAVIGIAAGAMFATSNYQVSMPAFMVIVVTGLVQIYLKGVTEGMEVPENNVASGLILLGLAVCAIPALVGFFLAIRRIKREAETTRNR